MAIRQKSKDELPDPEVIPDASLHRDGTFLTSMDVANTRMFKQYRTQKKNKSPKGTPSPTREAVKGFDANTPRTEGVGLSQRDASPPSKMSPPQVEELNTVEESKGPSPEEAENEQDKTGECATESSKSWGPSEARMYGDGSAQFLISKGFIDEDTREFHQFKRKNVNDWGAIS